MAEPTYIPPESALARRIRDLERRLAQLERPTGSQNNRNKDKVQAALDDLAAQANALQEQVDFQASLITVATQVPSFNSGTIPNDGAIHWLTTAPSLALSITLAVPTGRALVSYGCGEMSVYAATSATEIYMGFDLNDDAPNYTTRVFHNLNGWTIGAGASRSRAMDVTPGDVTFRARFGVYSDTVGAGGSSVQLNNPWMSVQVLRPL